MSNHFLSLEASEGFGKTTQAHLLAEALRNAGHEVILTREPGGTAGAEAIRALLLSHDHDWSPRAEALLFAAARVNHVENLILPSLRAGKWVVCDRFVDSTRAYQGASSDGRGGLSDKPILDIHNITTDHLLPELTILLDVPEVSTEVGAAPIDQINARLLARDGEQSDRIGGRAAAFHAQVREIFRAIARTEPQRVHTVSALGTIDEVRERICDLVEARFPGTFPSKGLCA